MHDELREYRNSSMGLVVLPIKAEVSTKNYSYLIYDSVSSNAVVVDPAGDLRNFNEVIAKKRLNLLAVLITHTHFDHVALAVPMASLYECKIIVSSKEDLGCFSSIMHQVSVADTDEPFQVGSVGVTAIQTPGHTMGSTCYLIGSNLFTGDTLFIEGCGVCVGEKADPRLLFLSLNKLKALISQDTKIYPGHSFGYEPGKDFSFVLKNNIYLQFEDYDMFASFRMRKSQPNMFAFR